MSRQFTSLLALSIIASGAIAESRFVTPASAQATVAGANTLGVARFAAADTEQLTVDVLGTAVVETGAALTANGPLQIDASGRVIDKAAGVTVARLLPGQTANAAGQFVEVILIPN
jgi:hypothetical protein